MEHKKETGTKNKHAVPWSLTGLSALLYNPYSTVPHVAITGNVVIIVNKNGQADGNKTQSKPNEFTTISCNSVKNPCDFVRTQAKHYTHFPL